VRHIRPGVQGFKVGTDKTDQVRRLLGQCKELSTERKSLESRLPALLSAINHNPKDRQAFANLAEFVKETDPILSKTQSIMDEAQKLTQSVVSDLAFKRKESEGNYDRTTILSYILFVLGWGTGLAGQLLGVGDQAES
jgi:hypothetical protein